MCSIYLINVGANDSHASVARSPVFNNLSFVYVSILDPAGTQYPPEMHPFVRAPDNRRTHSDPDWDKLTYGDVCSNRKAAALKNVTPGDILLFWGMLWQNNGENNGNNWHGCGFTGERGWYLLGALRVAEIVKRKQDIDNLAPPDKCRAIKNAHCLNRRWNAGDRVFLGEKDKKYSRLFDKAVELWVPKTEQKSESKWKDSLLYKALRAADGRYLSLNGTPRWYSSLRTCRKMWVWDLNNDKQRERTEIVKKAIQKVNEDFDLLKDAHCDPK